LEIRIRSFRLKTLDTAGGHQYLEAEYRGRRLTIFFKDRREEKRIFSNADLTIIGEAIEAEDGLHLLEASVTEISLHCDIPLEPLSIKDRLYATGLINEFKDVHKKDKYRALEILKALGVSESYAEDLLISRKNVLPFI
jgi:hypothetical protein